MEVLRVFRGPDRGEAEMLVFDADAQPTSRVRGARVGHPVRRRGSSRAAWIAIGALVVLTAGVAAGSLLEEPGLDGATNPSGACVEADLDEVPAFRLGVAGSNLLIEGQVAIEHLPGDASAPPVRWRVPPLGRAGSAPGISATDRIQIRVDGNRCIRYLSAERAPASIANPTGADRRAMANAPISPSGPGPAVGVAPDGDWVIRVTAYFETGIDGSGGLVMGERYFRVRVGDGPLPPPPTPDTDPRPPVAGVTPDVPCSGAPAAEEGVQVVLSVPGSGPVPGASAGVDLPVVAIGAGEEFEIAVAGDACALSWTITVFDAETGRAVGADAFLNPDNLPATGSQNRWRFDIDEGPHDVVANLHLGPGLDVARFWRVVGEGFRVPDVVVTGENGATATAVATCGLNVELRNGYRSSEECQIYEVPDSVPELHVPAWSKVSLDVSGWSLGSWGGQCGYPVDDGAGGTYFEWECSLGGYYGDEARGLPGPAQFLARPGNRLIQLYIQARSEAGSFSVTMFVRIVGE